MRVDNLRYEKNGDSVKTSARVIWEDCQRPTQELYFSTTAEFAESLSCNPHAFLVACIMPALHHGEQRLSIEGEICPELKEGLVTAMNWMRFWWYKPDKKLVKIEAKTRMGYPKPRTRDRAGFLFSGGIDSLATLRSNRINYPSEHPGSIKDGLLVHGLEIREIKNFEYVLESVSALAKDADVTLVPIDTNIRSIGPESDKEFWENFWLVEFMGAAFAAIAHALAKRLTKMSINSDYDIPNIIPLSSHPLVDPNYSSSDLVIRHEGINLSRFERTRLVAGWDLALRNLRVCNKTELYKPGMLNCGRCEKCVRTMLALLALGVLERTYAFPIRYVDEELVMTAVQLDRSTVPLYGELIGPMEGIGRHDLVRAIRQKIFDYHQSEKNKKLRQTYIDPILDYDQKHLYGSLRMLKRIFSPGGGIWNK